MAVPTSTLKPVESTFNMFTTSYLFNPNTASVPGSVGGVDVDLPAWTCGHDLIVQEGCLPDVHRAQSCDAVETGIIQEAEPTEFDAVKNFNKFECKKYRFLPMVQSLGYQSDLPCGSKQSILDCALASIDAYGHVKAAKHLMLGHNSDPAAPDNPGIVYYGQSVTDPGVKVDICEALPALYQNKKASGPGSLIVPMNVFFLMMKNNLAFIGPDGRPYTSVGTPILLDTGITGDYGPPATVWDQSSPIGLGDLQPAPAGCDWIYMTTGVATNRTVADELIEVPEGDEKEIKANKISALPEIKTIAVFNPCQVYAALIDSKVPTGGCR